MKASKALLRAEGLRLSFGNQAILQGVDLEISRGEIVTLIGPNGAGKTTLVKVLLGLISPDAGNIIKSDKLHIGYVPQKLHIDQVLPLSVARLMTLTKKHSRADVLQALRETEVDDLIDSPVQVLSGGQFQRVLLARALLMSPDLLVLDEPVQGVDFMGEAALYDLIGRIRDIHECGVLMVSHDLHLVMAATDRVLCLNGHICCQGEPKEVAEHSEFRRMFGPRASAFAVYSHHHDHEHDLLDGGSHVHGPDCTHSDVGPIHKDGDHA